MAPETQNRGTRPVTNPTGVSGPRQRSSLPAKLNFDAKICLAGAKTWLLKRAVGPFRARLRELRSTQWWTADQLHAYQLARLRRTLAAAYQDVPFYRRWFDAAGFDPYRVHDLTDLSRIPILTKRDVIEAGAALYSRRFPRWLMRTAHTGGTTGTPLNIRRDLWSIGNEHAFVRRQWEWAGIALTDRTAYLTGRVIIPPNQRVPRPFRFDPMMRELILSIYHLDRRNAALYLEAMRDFRVRALIAYPSAALRLADAVLDSAPRPDLRAVLTTAETLNSDARARIAAAFCCPVFDFYGSAERVCYIFTCERGSYHVVPEYGITELIPDTRQPALSKVVATGFWNGAMPLVRYELADLVDPGPINCPCGRAFPTITRIAGRPSDCIVFPGGRYLGSALSRHLLSVLSGASNVCETQLVQDAKDHLVLRYVPAPAFSANDRAALLNLAADFLPADVHVSLERVHVIPRTASGKFRPLVTLVSFADHD